MRRIFMPRRHLNHARQALDLIWKYTREARPYRDGFSAGFSCRHARVLLRAFDRFSSVLSVFAVYRADL